MDFIQVEQAVYELLIIHKLRTCDISIINYLTGIVYYVCSCHQQIRLRILYGKFINLLQKKRIIHIIIRCNNNIIRLDFAQQQVPMVYKMFSTDINLIPTIS